MCVVHVHVCVCVSIFRCYNQMISLYKDPEGEHVFGYAEEEVAQISTVFVDKVQCKDCQLLRRKVIQLEKICNSRKVRNSRFVCINATGHYKLYG